MKKLNKPPTIPKTIHYGKAEGFNYNYSFVFSESLPYERKTRAEKSREWREKL